MAEALNLDQGLLGLLECPVCFEYMLPPILQCKLGHNVCSKCKPNLKVCPTCRGKFENARNFTLEQIAEKLSKNAMYFCKYHKDGCNEKHKIIDLARHETYQCTFRLFDCPIGQLSGGCSWKGKKKGLVDHVRHAHKDKTWMKRENDVEENFDYSDLRDIELVTAFNKNFWFHYRADATRKVVSMAVQFIGPPKDAGEFVYKVDFESKDGTRSLGYTRRTHKDTVDMTTVFEHDDCFTASFNAVHFFIRNKKLEYSLNIERA